MMTINDNKFHNDDRLIVSVQKVQKVFLARGRGIRVLRVSVVCQVYQDFLDPMGGQVYQVWKAWKALKETIAIARQVCCVYRCNW